MFTCLNVGKCCCLSISRTCTLRCKYEGHRIHNHYWHLVATRSRQSREHFCERECHRGDCGLSAPQSRAAKRSRCFFQNLLLRPKVSEGSQDLGRSLSPQLLQNYQCRASFSTFRHSHRLPGSHRPDFALRFSCDAMLILESFCLPAKAVLVASIFLSIDV